MTAKEKLRAQVDQLTDAEAEMACVVIRRTDDDCDEWGSLSAWSMALATMLFQRLDEEERAAGFDPW